jgi:hypothetical protein
MSAGAPPRFQFFLGGQDLEMQTIAGLLREQIGAEAVHDKGLAWGASASDYGTAIAAAAAAGERPVLIELALDQPVPEQAILIDHHGERAGEPCSLRQVFDLLGLPASRWSRHFALVAANDTGHVAALRRMGASPGEVAAIRAADRAAQGATQEEEAAGLAALKAARASADGSMLIVALPHGRTATVMDPLVMQEERRDVLVLTTASTQFFGSGARIAQLDAAFPGGWRGGELPLRGFWGIGRALPSAVVERALMP